MVNGLTRLQSRFLSDPEHVAYLQTRTGEAIDAQEADALGLATFIPDDIDWEDEVRLALEERASFSSDGLDGYGREPAFRRPGNHGKQDFRPFERVAELDFSSAPTPSARAVL